jgi:phosphate:Na+ symporter
VKDFQIVLAAISSIILFIFGLENFSKEVQRITGEKFRKFLSKATKVPLVGFIMGAFITAFIQSSSATSVIAISLVNAGVLSFKNSIGIILGANVGTTVTSQLVAFKLTTFAPYFIILGFILSFIKSKYSVFAKSLFYFGFVFFTLNLISNTLSPLQADPRLVQFFTQPQGVILGLFIGIAVTAIVQSSSVTTGLAIIFAQQGLLDLDNAIPILMGANIGTTVTALFSIMNMDIAAKKTALAHFLFNLGGVLLFLPLIYLWKNNLPLFSDDTAIALANFHLIFNLTTSFAFLILIQPFSKLIDRLLGEGQMDFERIDLSTLSVEEDFKVVKKELILKLDTVYDFVQETNNLVTLSIETNYKGVYEAAIKRIEYMDHFKNELLEYFSSFIAKCNDETQVSEFVNIMSRYEYLFQIHDSVRDITGIKVILDEGYIELKSDLLLVIRDISSETLTIFDESAKRDLSEEDMKLLKKKLADFQNDLFKYNKVILKMMAMPERKDAGAIIHLITYSQRLKDKLVNYRKLSENLVE